MSYRYDYAICSSTATYYLPLFFGLDDLENVRVVDYNYILGHEKNYSKKNFIATFSHRLSRRKQQAMFRAMYDGFGFSGKRPICFIFCEPFYVLEHRGIAFIDYIKEQNPNNKIVVMLSDLVKKKSITGAGQMENMKLLRDKIDLITSHDKKDAEVNDLYYMKEMMYAPIVPVTKPLHFETDLFFLGRAKDRLDLLVALSCRLSQHGLSCDFNIMDVGGSVKVDAPGIHYVDHVTYDVCLKKMQNSKCVLEIVQGGSSAHTLRTAEAVIFRRKLLTNNQELAKDTDIYHPQQMSIFSSVDDVDIDFLKQEIDYSDLLDVEWPPLRRLDQLEAIFLQQKGGAT